MYGYILCILGLYFCTLAILCLFHIEFRQQSSLFRKWDTKRKFGHQIHFSQTEVKSFHAELWNRFILMLNIELMTFLIVSINSYLQIMSHWPTHVLCLNASCELILWISIFVKQQCCFQTLPYFQNICSAIAVKITNIAVQQRTCWQLFMYSHKEQDICRIKPKINQKIHVYFNNSKILWICCGLPNNKYRKTA